MLGQRLFVSLQVARERASLFVREPQVSEHHLFILNMAFSSAAHLWLRRGKTHPSADRGREVDVKGTGELQQNGEKGKKNEIMRRGGGQFNHSFWLLADNGQCLWMKIALQCNFDVFLPFFFTFSQRRERRERETTEEMMRGVYYK